MIRNKEKSDFGKRLELALDLYNRDNHSQHMSYAGLARRINVSNIVVSEWNSGVKKPTDANIKKISIILKVPYDWLKTGTHEFKYPLTVEEYKARIIEIVEEIDDVAVLAGIADSIEELLKLVPSAYMNGGFADQPLFQSIGSRDTNRK